MLFIAHLIFPFSLNSNGILAFLNVDENSRLNMLA